MPPTPSTSATRPDELLRVAQEYADLFNASRREDIERLISDACVDAFWDDRTNLLLMLADDPEELGLVLATDPENYVVVRFGGEWVVDTSPVDWDDLEEQAFAGEAGESYDGDPYAGDSYAGDSYDRDSYDRDSDGPESAGPE
jgi:hypothetical protein